MARKLAILKLAAMGDVAIASRAVADILSRAEQPIELDWLIDAKLQPLATALLASVSALERHVIRWHPIDAARVFQGSSAEKATEALKMHRVVRRARPDCLVLLHRDWRYKALLRTAFMGTIVSVDRERKPELAVYQTALETAAAELELPLRGRQIPKNNGLRSSGKLGLLVGGAQNQKLLFAEKRWPRLGEFLSLLLRETEYRVVLFGGPEDRPIAESLVRGLGHDLDRVEDLTGKLPLDKLPEALATLDRFVSIDSGLAHVAATVMNGSHQKIVTLFGPTDPEVWAPVRSGQNHCVTLYKRKQCSPCYRDDGDFKSCPFTGPLFQHCMTDITAAEVLAALA